jgi:hypothetical protein
MAAPGALSANAASWSAGGSGSGSDSGSGSGGGGGSDTPWLSLPKPTQRLPGALLDFLPQDNNDASASAAEARSTLQLHAQRV